MLPVSKAVNLHSNSSFKANTDYYYALDEFVIKYSLDGENKLVNQTDLNNNLIPDVIEDLMTHLIASREMFSYLGFKHPLQQERYQQVNKIVVVLKKSMEQNLF